MLKFKLYKKGRLTSFWNDRSYYRKWPHTGVDWKHGYGTLVQCDNAGYVYKVHRPGEREDNWSAVYMLVPVTKDTFMEICYGHLSEVYVYEGEDIPEDMGIGAEGNCGLVFSNGVQITPEMQRRGDRRGSHVHESWRPVRRVEKMTPGQHYLEHSGAYKGLEGHYYEVIHTNDVRGTINPLTAIQKETMKDRVANLLRIINYLKTRVIPKKD